MLPYWLLFLFAAFHAISKVRPEQLKTSLAIGYLATEAYRRNHFPHGGIKV